MMLQRRTLLPGHISTNVEPLFRRTQADALMTTSTDQGSEHDVSQVEN